MEYKKQKTKNISRNPDTVGVACGCSTCIASLAATTFPLLYRRHLGKMNHRLLDHTSIKRNKNVVFIECYKNRIRGMPDR